MNESISESFYKQLKDSTNKIQVLVNFYKSLFELDSVDSNIYGIIGKLIKVYGEEIVYFSLLDCAFMDNIDHKKIVVLLSYFAKKRLQEKYDHNIIPNLDNIVEKNIKELETKRRIKIPEVEI